MTRLNVVQGFFPHDLPRPTRHVAAAPLQCKSGTPQWVQDAIRRSAPLPASVTQPIVRAPQPAVHPEAMVLPPHLAQLPQHGGQPLPVAVQRKMERSLGARFSDVRVHISPAVSVIGAVALTQGTNIHFAPGHYDPSTPRGEQILRHELTHVMQQRAGLVTNPFGHGVAVVQNKMLDAQAQRAMVIQRETLINADQYAYDPEEKIRTTRHVRTKSPGGNHFVPHKFIADTVIDIIWEESRRVAAGILFDMTTRVGHPIPSSGYFQTRRDYDDFVDDCIHAISDHANNRWQGQSNGDGGGTLLDQPNSPADKKRAADFGTYFGSAVVDAYNALNGIPPHDVTAMLRRLERFVDRWK